MMKATGEAAGRGGDGGPPITGGGRASADGSTAELCPSWLLEVCGLGAPPGCAPGEAVTGRRLSDAAEDGCDDEAWGLAGGAVAIVHGGRAAACLGPACLQPPGVREALAGPGEGAVRVQEWPPRLGEVWLRGCSVTAGYWGNASATAASFGRSLGAGAEAGGTVAGAEVGGTVAGAEAGEAGTAGEVATWPMMASGRPQAPGPVPDGMPWVSTGDLGFVWRGELFLTGRLKDLVIVGGRNHYPADIEASAEALGREEGRGVGILRPGCTAAFAVPAGVARRAAAVLGMAGAAGAGAPEGEDGASEEEVLVVAGEPRPDPTSKRLPPRRVLEAVARGLAGTVAAAHGVTPRLVLLLPSHSVRKTSSGKVARLWNARALRQLADGDAAGPWGAGRLLLAGFAAAAPSAAARRRPETAVHDGRTLAGAELLTALRAELAVCGGVSEAGAIPEDAAVSALGLSSLAIAQWVGSCRSEFGLIGIDDDAVWGETFTLTWVAENAAALRRGECPEPRASETRGTGAAGATGASKAPAHRIQLPGVHESTWCEKNFPCCPCCH